MPRLDYDRIAHLFDEPARDHPLDPDLVAFVESLSIPKVSILDVGCGTGKQLASNRARYPEMVMVGVDRFRKMLTIANRRCPSVTWIQGDGTALPLKADSFDYASNQFSYPHIADKPALIRELFRVLKPGGRFVMTHIDPWRMPGWNIYRFFPEAWTIDEKDFLRVDAFVELMRGAGFRDVRVEHREVHLRGSLRGFQEYASSRHRNSQFMVIPDEAYQAGLDRIEEAVHNAADPDAPEDSLMVLVAVAGDKPVSAID